MAITRIQYAYAVGGSITIGAPAVGNWLVAIGIDTTAPAAGALWNLVGNYTGTGTLKGSIVCTKVTSGGITSWTPFTAPTTAAVILIVEYHADNGFGIGTAMVDFHQQDHSASAIPPSITTTATAPANGNDTALIVAYDNTTADTAPASVSGMTTISTLAA